MLKKLQLRFQNRAAWTAVDAAEDNQEVCHKVNVDGTANIRGEEGARLLKNRSARTSRERSASAKQKKRKEAEALLKQLGVGDEVQTNGGIVGRIVKVSDDGKYFVIAINETTNVTITRDYVVAPLPKGTLEAVQASAPKSSK